MLLNYLSPSRLLLSDVRSALPVDQVVVGDIMFLDTGDKVIADGIVIDSQGLVLDEASLTGAQQGQRAMHPSNVVAMSKDVAMHAVGEEGQQSSGWVRGACMHRARGGR